MTSIGPQAFMYCSNLFSVQSLIENPMNIDSSVFDIEIEYFGTLYVPIGTKSKYQACSGWQEFINIVEGSPTGIISSKIDNNEETKYYSIEGRRISKPHKGLNIINGKKVIVK